MDYKALGRSIGAHGGDSEEAGPALHLPYAHCGRNGGGRPAASRKVAGGGFSAKAPNYRTSTTATARRVRLVPLVGIKRPSALSVGLRRSCEALAASPSSEGCRRGQAVRGVISTTPPLRETRRLPVIVIVITILLS